MPEFTSIVIRQSTPPLGSIATTSPIVSRLTPPPQPPLPQQQQQPDEIQEVALESLPEMVTELFEAIPPQQGPQTLTVHSAPTQDPTNPVTVVSQTLSPTTLIQNQVVEVFLKKIFF